MMKGKTICPNCLDKKIEQGLQECPICEANLIEVVVKKRKKKKTSGRKK